MQREEASCAVTSFDNFPPLRWRQGAYSRGKFNAMKGDHKPAYKSVNSFSNMAFTLSATRSYRRQPHHGRAYPSRRLLDDGPALAADEFYVVQDVKTKKCTIVDKKPTTTTETTILGTTVYKTRTEAEAGMKTVKVCTTN